MKNIINFIKNGDMCTNFPDIIGKYNLKLPCYLHDLSYKALNKISKERRKFHYSITGISLLTDNKFKADLRLYKNIKMEGNHFIATIMFIGVTLFGHRYYRK